MDVIRENPTRVMLAVIAVVVLLAYFCYRSPDCPLCQFLEAFN